MRTLRTLSIVCLALVSRRSDAAELFIKINGGGTYEIMVDDQLQRNSSGNFRFFDVPTGNIQVRIKEGNSAYYTYDRRININNHRRYIYEYADRQLIDAGTCNMSNDCGFPGSSHQHYSNNNGCDEASFNEMLNMLKEKSFDSQIIEKAKVFTPKANFTSSQVRRICDLMQYDSNKLEYARYAYDYVVDKGSYFIVEKTFTYNSSKSELEEYIKDR